MSRTIKDMPYVVRGHDYYNRKTPANWREDGWWDDVRWDGSGINTEKMWRVIGFGDSLIGSIAREENRKYRAVCKQKMRNGNYEFDKPRRNARWLAY